ncbi:hypothetical protein [Niallia circulans]|uniref:hypothetical protein n=1 Tax=Niallia circulans TaxID=1397 RepID=UPI003519A414
MRIKEIREAILKKSNVELNKWIRQSFSLNNSVHEAMNISESLRKLDDRTLMYGIARMEQIETGYDHSKYSAPLVALLAAWFGIYTQVVPKVVSFLLFSLFILCFCVYSSRTRKKREAAVYFKSLLIQIKESKKRREDQKRL